MWLPFRAAFTNMVMYLAACEGASLVKASNVHISCQLQLPRIQHSNAPPLQTLNRHHNSEDHDSWDTNRHGHDDGVQESEEGFGLQGVHLGLGPDGGNVKEEMDDEGEQVDAEDVLQNMMQL